MPLEVTLIDYARDPLQKLYGAYRTLIDPGDVAVYPVPSWNNNHYAYLSGARAVEIPVSAAWITDHLGKHGPHYSGIAAFVLTAVAMVVGSLLKPGANQLNTAAVDAAGGK